MKSFLVGKGFTYAIMSLYTLRAFGYAVGGDWARVLYWTAALAITVSAEFLIKQP